MELVSANTRNYLFLTMSQYNEQNGLVRARVSMRRDQAFWQGGNSFVACESFRISSAPSQGGLYYTILPDSFYVGAEDHATNEQKDADYTDLLIPPNNYTIGSRKVEGTPNNPLQANDIINLKFTMGVKAANAHPTPIPLSHPDLVLPIFGELWNDHGLLQGAKVEMKCDDASGAPVSLKATVSNNPLRSIDASGAGPDGLFYPLTGFWRTFDDEITTKLIGGTQMAMGLYNFGYPNLDPEVDISRQLIQRLGQTADFQLTTGPDGQLTSVPAALQCPGLTFWGPRGIEVDGIDLWNVDADGNPTTMKHKLYWDTDDLKAGSKVYIVTNGGIQHGTVTKIPHWLYKSHNTSQAAGPVQGVHMTECMWTLSGNYRTWLGNNANSWGTKNEGDQVVPARGADALTNMLQATSPWVLANQHMPSSIQVGVDFEVDADNDGPSLANFTAAVAAQSITEMKIKKVTHRTASRIERRACAQGEQKYIYTPNELYWLFNNPQGLDDDDEDAKSPYSLQTHENGGFKLEWDGTWGNFYMSVDMHTAMGFNDYFEHNITNTTKPATPTWDICLQKPVLEQQAWDQSYSSAIAHFAAPDVYAAGAGPLVPINPTTITVGTRVRTIDGLEWILVSKSEITTTNEESDTLKIYPTLTTDSDGNKRYTWKDLPKSVMGNTQQVSVESFGTFSGINIVIPNLPFQPMLGTASDDRILASLRLPFQYGTENKSSGVVNMTDFSYYGDLLFNSDSSRSYLRITTDQQLYDCDVEARLIRRDGGMEVLYLPYKGQFEIKLRFLQTQ